MDDYLRKPIRAKELYSTIDRVTARGQKPATEQAVSPLHPLLDAKAMLSSCGGDAALLARMIQSFQLHAPRQLAEMQATFEHRDLKRLSRLAHKLCGLLSAFSVGGADTARELEQMAAA